MAGCRFLKITPRIKISRTKRRRTDTTVRASTIPQAAVQPWFSVASSALKNIYETKHGVAHWATEIIEPLKMRTDFASGCFDHKQY